MERLVSDVGCRGMFSTHYHRLSTHYSVTDSKVGPKLKIYLNARTGSQLADMNECFAKLEQILHDHTRCSLIRL